MPFNRELKLRFHQLDPAGILFFAEAFTICSAVYEDFLSSLGLSWNTWFRSPDIACPVRHAEADYFQPLTGGETYTVVVEIENVGASSFEISYTIQKAGATYCKVRLVHVFISPQTRAKIPVPETVRDAFNRFGASASSAKARAESSPAASVAAPKPA